MHAYGIQKQTNMRELKPNTDETSINGWFFLFHDENMKEDMKKIILNRNVDLWNIFLVQYKYY